MAAMCFMRAIGCLIVPAVSAWLLAGTAAASGLAVDMAYSNDVWWLADGGIDRGVTYLDNLDVSLTADMDAIADLPGLTVFAYALYNNGKSFSGNRVGDAQVISNIETGVKALRLYEAWAEQSFAQGRASVRAGLYDLNAEFDALETAGLFLNAAHGIGTDIAQTGENGPSIFPVTALAVRGQAELGSALTVRAAVLDGVPGNPAAPARTAIRFSDGEGLLLIGEADVKAGPARLLAGYWRYTARFERSDDGGRARGNDGAYLRGEMPLWNAGGRTLSGFFRLGLADGRFNAFDRFASAGLVLAGLSGEAADDALGLALATAFAADASRTAAQAAGAPIDSSETAIELTYHRSVTDWLTVQPSVQYIINPGLDRGLGNALAVGVQTSVAFGN